MSKVRARVEHAIGIIKRVFGFAKVRYRGLKKNTHCNGADLSFRTRPYFSPSLIQVAEAFLPRLPVKVLIVLVSKSSSD